MKSYTIVCYLRELNVFKILLYCTVFVSNMINKQHRVAPCNNYEISDIMQFASCPKETLSLLFLHCIDVI